MTSDSGEIDPAQFEPSFELLQAQTKIARLESEVSIQAEQLDERETLLEAMSNELVAARAQTERLGELTQELEVLRSESEAFAQEVVQVQTQLEASKVERRNLIASVERAQHEKSLVDAKRSEIEQQNEELDVQNRELQQALSKAEGERDSQAQIHQTRAKELDVLKDDARRIGDVLDNLRKSLEDTTRRLNESEGLNERQRSQISFVERRIAKLKDQGEEVKSLRAKLAKTESELITATRKIKQLEDDSQAQKAETEAAKAAVDAIATDSAERAVLLSQIRQLKAENQIYRDERANFAQSRQNLIEEAKRLRTSRTSTQTVPKAAVTTETDKSASAPSSATTSKPQDTTGQTSADVALVSAQMVPPTPVVLPAESQEPTAVAEIPEPKGSEPQGAESQVSEQPLAPEPVAEILEPQGAESQVPDPQVSEPQGQRSEPLRVDREVSEATGAVTERAVSNVIDMPGSDEPVAPTSPFTQGTDSGEIEPELPTAQGSDGIERSLGQVELRLRQNEAVAIVDARSACSDLNIDPTQLLARVEWLRDHYRIPVHLVATPLATPRNGYPERHAIGVHGVEGNETTADRLLELAKAFPTRPVVIVTSDVNAKSALEALTVNDLAMKPVVVAPATLLALRTS